MPPWAHNDPQEFIRRHREALESRYVSENIHHWIDLIFGYKQRGKASVDAMNVFIHLTYEGEVDIDAIEDPIIQRATIAQINNFGQCPVRLFNKPHVARKVPNILKREPFADAGMQNELYDYDNIYEQSGVNGTGKTATGGMLNIQAGHDPMLDGIYHGKSNSITGTTNVTTTSRQLYNGPVATDATALAWYDHSSPPLCVLGAPHLVQLHKIGKTEHFTNVDVHSDRLAIGDIHLHRNAVLAVNVGGLLLPMNIFGKKSVRYGGPSCGFTVFSTGVVPSGSMTISNTIGTIGSTGTGILETLSHLGQNNNQIQPSGSDIRGTDHRASLSSKNVNSMITDQDKEVFSVHERLHEGPITCMFISSQGDLFFTGSTDCSVRQWSPKSLLINKRVKHVFTYIAHTR